MTEALNPEPLLRALHDAGVRHIIIGGFAVNAHGVIRPSRDLDIVRTPIPTTSDASRGCCDIDARHVRPGRVPVRSDLAGGPRGRRRCASSASTI
jgi:hypothetical protein